MPRALLLLLALAGAAAAQERVATVPGTTLSVTMPPDWTTAKAVDGAALVLRGPTPSDPELTDANRELARPSLAIAVVPMPADQTQAGMAYDAYKDLERLLTHFDPLRDRDYTRALGGRSWQCWHYTFQMGQLEFEQELFITAAGTSLVYATCSCDHDHFAAHRSALEAMVASMGGSRPQLDK